MSSTGYGNSRNKGATRYDAVVLDAPPTGRITRFLNVNDELAGLAKVGPVRSQADTVMTLFRSPRTAVHLVTVLEEMPVQETADGIAELEKAGLPVGAIVVNQVRPREIAPADLEAALAGRLSAGCHERGVLTLTCGTYGNVLRFLPPLVMPDHLLHEALDVLAEVLRADPVRTG